MIRRAQAWMFGVACAAALVVGGASAAQPTFGPKKPREKPAEPAGGEKPEGGAPKPAAPPKPTNPGVTQPPPEWNQDDGERKAPSGDAKPGEWFCWKTADGLRYAWSLPAKFVKGEGYDLIVMLHPDKSDFRWGSANHMRGEDFFRPDCLTVSVDGMAANARRPEMRSFECSAANCVRFRDVLLEFSRQFPVRHIILYGSGGGGKFAAYFSAAFPALADGVLDHEGGIVDGGAVKTSVPMVFMHGAKDSITPMKVSLEAVKAYEDAGHKGVRGRLLRGYNDFPNENCAAECIDYLRAMRTDDPAEVVAIAERMLAPKAPDEFGYRAAPWCAGAVGALGRVNGTCPAMYKFEKEPSDDVKKKADALLEKIEAEGEANAANIRTLLKNSGMEKGDFVLDGGAWLGYLLAVRDDFRGVKSVEKLATELKLDAKIAEHAEQAADLWTTWTVSANDADKFNKAVELITKCYLAEGLPVDLLPRCRACMKKADELELDAASKNLYEFIQLWEQGMKDGQEAYEQRWRAWE